MSGTTSIEWTDTTWNPVRGCDPVSPGCAHCYAEVFAERFRGVKGHPYEQGFDLRLVPEKLTEPLSWKKPRRVFVNSMSDLFQDGVPRDFFVKAWAVMQACPQHTFQVLTKRPERMRAILSDPTFEGEVEEANEELAGERGWCHAHGDRPFPLPNVWLGTSVENQHFADERIPLLLKTPAAVRFISAEPLLGRLLLDNGEFSWLTCHQGCRPQSNGDYDDNACWSAITTGKCFNGIDWVIVGGESGHGARPFDIAWARSIVKQCAEAGVACFVKQLGGRPIVTGDERRNWPIWDDINTGERGVKLVDRKGGDMAEWPEDLRVREFPAVAA